MDSSNSRNDVQAELEALRRENERLRALTQKERGLLDAILTQSPHGIIVSDAQGKLILSNASAERIWAGSATANDIEGWGQYRAFHPDGRPFEAGDWSMARCLRSGETIETEELHVLRFDGTHAMLLGSCAPVHASDGSLLGAVSIFADITRFKQVEQLKDRWVALAGHELRHPLTVMKTKLAVAQINLSRSSTVDLPTLFSHFEKQISMMDSLVNDMLDVSRAQAGSLEVEIGSVELKPMVDRVATTLVQGSPRHSLQLETRDVTVRADGMRTEQVITNLLSNAIRYSPQGGRIRVTLRVDGAEACVEVSDEGVGFSEHAGQQLFEPFVQAQRATHREGGLGLGLYLVRELMRRMNGRVWASSRGPGKGAVFGFALPVDQKA